MENGLIHIYCGDGKGKSTAAAGLAVRFAAYYENVVFCRFSKTSKSGELESLEKLGIKILQADIPAGFTWTLSAMELEEVKKGHDSLLDKVFLFSESGPCLIVLDEIVGAYRKGLIDKKKTLKFLDGKPIGAEIVMTGRDPEPELIERADYVTEMKKIKHPMDRNIKSKKGIEK